MIKYGGISIDKIMVGTATIGKVMYGDELVWQNIQWIYYMDMNYNDTNIATEFTSVSGTNTSSNAIVATDYDGYAISKVLGVADGADNPSTTDAFPLMTSNTSPSGICSQSQNDSDAYQAMDSVLNNAAVSSDATLPAWWQYEPSSPIAINKYRIHSNSATSFIKDFELLGSITGSFTGEEKLLHIGVANNINEWNDWFTFVNSTEYSYYRINILSNYGGTTYRIRELEFVESQSNTSEIITAIVSDGEHLQFEGEYNFITIDNGGSVVDTLYTNAPLVDGTNLVIIKNDSSVHEMSASNVDNSTVSIAPVMTTNNSPYGLTSASSINSVNNDAFCAFDQTNNNWVTALNTLTGTIAYTHNVSYLLTSYSVAAFSTGHSTSPRDWTLEGSNNATDWSNGSWSIIDTQVNQSILGGSGSIYEVSPSSSYSSYRLVITANNGSPDNLVIAEIRFISEHITMNTSSITNGEIPSRTFMIDAKAEFDFGLGYIEATKSSDNYVYSSGTNPPFLSSTRKYDNLDSDNLEGVGIISKVTLRNIDDSMLKLTGTIAK